MAETTGETRECYRHFLAIPTRWIDNDIYGHVNNVRYYEYFDTVINRYLIEAGGLDIHDGDVIGIAVETTCRFHRSLAFPDVVNAGLRVGKLGTSSVRYEIGLFRGDDVEPAATGHLCSSRARPSARRRYRSASARRWSGCRWRDKAATCGVNACPRASC